MLRGPGTYPIAIDMTGDDIFAAQLTEGRKGMVIRELFRRRIEKGNGESPDVTAEQVAAFTAIRKNRRFAGKRVVVHLPPQSIFRFPIRFRLNGGETVEEAIVRESKDYLPFPMEEAVLDYPSLVSPPPGEGGLYRAMIIAARRDEIGKFMGLLKQVGLVVEAVDFRLASLVRLHRLLDRIPEDPILLCNIGETESMLATMTDKSVLAQHYVAWGTRALLDKVRAGFGLKDASRKAEALLRRYGLLYEDRATWKREVDASKEATAVDVSRAIYQIVSPHIEELVYELHKLISYVRSEEHNASFQGIYLYGEAAVIRHLDSCLERRLSIPTQVMEPMSRMNLSEEGILPDRSRGGAFGPALGLAMRRVKWL